MSITLSDVQLLLSDGLVSLAIVRSRSHTRLSVTVEFVVGDGTQPKGVDKAVRGMKKGEQLRVTCQPSAAYRDAGLPAQGVAPGAVVRFYITLVDFSKLKVRRGGPASTSIPVPWIGARALLLSPFR